MFILSVGVLRELVAIPLVPAPGYQHWPDSLVNDEAYEQIVVKLGQRGRKGMRTHRTFQFPEAPGDWLLKEWSRVEWGRQGRG